jgi:hypothetical protein
VLLKSEVSVDRLEAKGLDSAARLPWAQEVWSSNLHAPTKVSNRLETATGHVGNLSP